MAYTITELQDSRTLGVGQSASAELVYLAVDDTVSPDYGTNLEKAALDAVVAAAPTTFEGMAQIGARVRPVDGQRTYRVSVQYGVPTSGGGFSQPLGVNEYRVDFPGGSGSELVTQAYTERRYGDDPTPADLGGAINVTERGVEGVTIETPEFAWSETWIRDNATATWSAITAIALLRKTVNNAAFRGFAAGEVFLDDFAASPRTDDDWEYRFKFRARSNRLNTNANGGADPATPLEPGDPGYNASLDNTITIGTIDQIQKYGWEYLWIRYERDDDGTGNLVEKPRAVYVDEVYLASDFSSLGLGTGTLF